MGELAGLQRHNVYLRRGVIVIDKETGALHESARRLWLGPPKTPSSARTIPLPKFLTELLREHITQSAGGFVFTSPEGCRLRRSDFNRRVLRPAADGDARRGMTAVRPGLTFHGLRHSHKTWLIADGIPEIAQAKRLGHHLANRLIETYSHVAPEIEAKLLRVLERRWKHATTGKPDDNRPLRRKDRARRKPAARLDKDDHVARLAKPVSGARMVDRAEDRHRPWLPTIARPAALAGRKAPDGRAAPIPVP